MKHRGWVPVVALVLTVIIGGGYLGWHLSGAEEKIRETLLSRIRPFLAQESDIEKVKIDLSNVHVQGVRLSPRDRAFSVDIQEVTLGFQLWSLILHGFSLEKVTHEITLVHPVIILNKDKTATGVSDSQDWLDVSEVAEALRSVKRILVVSGEIFVSDSLENGVRLAHSLTGWMASDPLDSAFVQVTGKLFESRENNLTAEGKLNLYSGRPVRLDVHIKESDPTSQLPYLLPPYMLVTGGKMQGELRFDRQAPAAGSFEIKNGNFTFKNARLNFENVGLKGTLVGKDVMLEGEVASFNGSPLTIIGEIFDVFDPEWDVSVHSSSFNIPAFLNTAVRGPDLQVRGRASLGIRLTGSLRNPVISGNLTSRTVNLYGFEFSDFRTDVGLKDSVLTLDGSGKQDKGISLAMKGSVDFSNPLQQTRLELGLKGDLLPSLPEWSKKGITAFQGQMDVLISGMLKDFSGDAVGWLLLVSTEGDTLRLLPDLKYRQKNIELDIRSNTDFRMSGMIRSPFYPDHNWNLNAESIESLLRIVPDPGIKKVMNRLRIQGKLEGNRNLWSFVSSGRNIGNGKHNVFDLSLNSRKVRAGSRLKLDGLFRSEPGDSMILAGEGTLSSALQIDRLEAGGFLRASGRIPASGDGVLAGTIDLSALPLEKLHSLFPGLEPFFGSLTGRISFGGKRNAPDVAVNLTLDNGRFHDVGLIDGTLSGAIIGARFQNMRLEILKDGFPTLSGQIRMQGDSLGGSIRGNAVNLADLTQALTGKKLLSGEGDIEIRAGSAEGIPVFSGTLTADGGSVGPVKFQQLYTEFADTLMPGTGLFSGTLTIVKGSLEREDGTRLLLWGNISHGKEEESDVSFLAEGDILGMLPEISEVFGSAEGSGKLFLRWSGRHGDWALGSGWMEVSGGQIVLNSIIKSITEINGKAELRQDERFIRIPEITGKIGSSPFLLTNTDSSAVPQGLAPLELPGLDVHIGVIQIRTEGKGLRLHIPGLMEKGEEGWLGFAGMQPGESFVIAGPASNPLLRGTLNLTDNRITYPFLKLEGDSGTSRTLELLKRVNWDLRIIPRNDVHFVREVESPFGNVIVDLKVRDDYGKFGLSGIPEEEDLQFSADLISTEGTLLVLEHYFKPERITFSFSRGAEYPILSGRAYTTLTDSLGMPSTVWLNITAPDNELGMVMKEGSWETVRFRFSTDNPNLARNEADLLAALGFSMKDMPDRAYSALGMQVENIVFRPLFRPLERGIRRYLGLDVVHLYSMFSRNLVQLQSSSSTEFDAKYLLRSTKFMLGKYLTPGLFLTYSGQFEDNLGFHYLTPGLGYRQSLTLEYTIRPDLFLQMEYTYDSQLLEDRRQDKRIWLRHIFPF